MVIDIAAQSVDQESSVLYLDVDQLNVINSMCDRSAGDWVLAELRALLRSRVPSQAVLGNLGSDEIGILVPGYGVEQALRLAHELKGAIRERVFLWCGKRLLASVSIGVFTFEHGVHCASHILSQANSICLIAKSKGRDTVCSFLAVEPELIRQGTDAAWASEVQQALDTGSFRLYSQTIQALGAESDKIDHYEILIRMFDGQQNLISPAVFVPAAERYGLAGRLDRWVIRQAFCELSRRNPVGLPIQELCSINLSGCSVSDPTLVDFICEQLRQYALNPNAVCFEITETAAISNFPTVRSLIHHLSALGCRFALDDFGSGMSSLNYLKQLPVDFVKIDGGFVKDMLYDPFDYSMVEAITRIGHAIGAGVIAEYVETGAILAELRYLGVESAQGYFVGHPHPFESRREAEA